MAAVPLLMALALRYFVLSEAVRASPVSQSEAATFQPVSRSEPITGLPVNQSEPITALPASQSEAGTGNFSDPSLLPPVIYNQTLGPVYIRDHNEYHFIWCNATPGANVTWRYNGVPLEGDSSEVAQVQFKVRPGNLMIIDQNHLAIDGYVQCFATNDRGSTFGEKVFVTHANLTEHPTYERHTTLSAAVGEAVPLSCDRHIKDVPAANVGWTWTDRNRRRHDLRHSSKDGFFCNAKRSVCVLAHVTPEDAGEYTCSYKIKGKPGGKSKIFRVLVETSGYSSAVRPINLIQAVSSPSLVLARVGEDAHLKCAFRGYTGETVTWSRAENDCEVHDSGVLDTTSDRYESELAGSSFRIRDVALDDEGYYLCVADNGYDHYSHRIQLRVVSPPVLTERVYGVQASLGASVRLNCSVSLAVPEPNVTWYVNTEVVGEEGLGHFRLEDGGASLVLYNATLEDTSGVTCNASNIYGSMLGHRYINVLNVTIRAEETTTAEQNETKTTTIGGTNTTETETETNTTEFPTSDALPTERPTTEETDRSTHKDDVTWQFVTSDKPDMAPPPDGTTGKSDPNVGMSVLDPSYRQTNDPLSDAQSKPGSGRSKIWQQDAWPWILVTLAVFVCGVLIGALVTRCYSNRRQSENIPQESGTSNIIANRGSIRAYNRSKRSPDKCRAGSPETEYMMTSSCKPQMETVT